jgi:hypothetical protein
MKLVKLSMLIALVAITLSSCKKDPNETIIGSWDTSDGGTITFNANGTGTTQDSEFFEFDCGTLNGNRIGPIPSFSWEITDNGTNENLFMAFEDSTSFVSPCSGNMEFPVTFSSKNKGKVGTDVLIDISVDLTRK